MTGAALHGEQLFQGGGGFYIRVAANESGFMRLGFGDHRRLVFDGLGTEHEGESALTRERNGQLGSGNGLHACGHNGNVELETASLSAFESGDRNGQGCVAGDVLSAGQSRQEEVFSECAGGIGKYSGHDQI